jgi:hypothetical protein
MPAHNLAQPAANTIACDRAANRARSYESSAKFAAAWEHAQHQQSSVFSTTLPSYAVEVGAAP